MNDAEHATDVSWWSLARGFLERFAAGSRSSPIAHPDARYDAWMDVADRAGQLLDERDEHEPTPWPGLSHALEQLADLAGEPCDAAHAIASILDERFSRTFPDDWIAGSDADFELHDNDLYPVLETPWMVFHPYLSRPASMTDPRRDELAHMRRFEVSSVHPDKITGVRVHRVTGLLRDVLTTVGTIATVHPNIALDELQWPDGRQLWPVTVRDPERQVQIVQDLVNAALDGGSRLIVLPELSATDDTIAAVRALIDARYDEDEDPAIVLAGSQHVELGDGQRRNRAVTLISGTPVELHHDKLDVEHVLERLGVNLLLVPAMSVKTPNLPLAAARLLHTAQTVTVVANSPLIDAQAGRSLAHCSLTARPTADGPAVVSWPSGGAHASKPQAPVWVGHPLVGGTPRASPQSH